MFPSPCGRQMISTLVASKLPSVLKDIQRTTSGWLSIIFTATPSSRFQIRICQSYPALSRIPLQVGCHSISPALRLWPIRIIRASVMFLLKPPSGICQILTWSSKVKSSELDAMMLSMNGLHLMSITLPWWPQTFG